MGVELRSAGGKKEWLQGARLDPTLSTAAGALQEGKSGFETLRKKRGGPYLIPSRGGDHGALNNSSSQSSPSKRWRVSEGAGRVFANNTARRELGGGSKGTGRGGPVR